MPFQLFQSNFTIYNVFSYYLANASNSIALSLTALFIFYYFKFKNIAWPKSIACYRLN